MKKIYNLLFCLLSATFVSAQINADFSFDPMSVCEGETFNFTDESTGGPVAYIWDFGDGTTSTQSNPSHIYTSGGNYQVCLTVSDIMGNESMECKELTVLPSGSSQISETICWGEVVTINGDDYFNPGFYSITLPNGGFNGCDSIVLLELMVVDESTTVLDFEVCENDVVNYNGIPLDPGVHTFVFTSSNGCDSIVVVNVNFEPLAVTNLEFFFCEGESTNINGTVYDLSNPSGTEVILGGSVFGCDSIINITINTGLQFNALITNAACDDDVGSIDITVNNGTAPYTYTWLESGGSIIATTQNLTNITSSGNYTLEVSDASNCSNSTTYLITIPDPIVISATVTNLSCDVLFDGSIILSVAGGTPGYSFSWSNGSNAQDIQGLSSGLYSLTLTDANGCTLVDDFEVEEIDPISLNITASDLVCDNDGFIMVEPMGGTAPYEYLWSTGSTTQNLENLIAGTYDVSVWGLNGCMASATIVLASPIGLEITTTFAECDSTNGTATALLGGVTNADFAWSNGGTTAIQNDLAPGWYSVTVTDQSNDCKTHQNVEVFEDTICYVVISGYVYVNEDNPDCTVDANTFGAAFVTVELSDGQITFTDGTGYYEFTTDAGNYDVSLTYNSTVFDPLCADDLTVIASDWGETYSDNNFFFKYAENRDLKLKIVKQNARPGFTQYVNICLMNVGAVPVSGTLTFVHPDIQTFQSSFPSNDDYDAATNTVSWDFEDIPPGAVFVYTNYLLTPVGTALGTELEYSFKAEPITGDLTPDNNEETCSMLVTGSYDPNDKQVTPAGWGPNGAISMEDTLLTYRIRFQNTGTDTAFTVLIRDTLDANLDVRSIVPGASSHAYTATISDENVLELLFENILLPDSFINEPASNGFVFFDIELHPDLEYETRIENRAGIYFDFNPPILTNTVVNTIQMITPIEELDHQRIPLSLSPNPVKEETTLAYTLKENESVSIAIYDLNGRLQSVVRDKENQSAGLQQLSIRDLSLPSGVYMLQVRTLSGESGMVKFVQF